MSILELNREEKYLEGVYKQTMFWEKLDIFDIKTPFRMDLEAEAVAKHMENGNSSVHQKRKKKRKLELPESIQNEISYLKEKLPIFLSMKQSHFSKGPSVEDIRHNNKTLRENVKALVHTLHSLSTPDYGQNSSNHCVEQGGAIVPPKSKFRKQDVMILEEWDSSTYDLILMDPPWSNKHVKRVKMTGAGYKMMDNDDLEKMPVTKLLNDDGLLFVWCTNKVKHRAAVTAWFTSWGLSMVGTWYWVKVTKHGEMVTQFTQDKQPY